MNPFFALIEAGGTKFNCAIVDADREILAFEIIATTTPEQTLAEVVNFFERYRQQYPFSRLGLATFGPIDLDPQSANYGFITATPKPHWSNTPLVSLLEEALQCPVSFDTDVNAAALAEYLWGGAQATRLSVYVTVGTGIGGGIVANGQILHGLLHPELGHMLIPANQQHSSVCPFHDNCLTAFAAGLAVAEYWQQSPQHLDASHPAWDCQVDYLAKMCHNLMVILAPQRIALGGGIMEQSFLLPRIVEKTAELLNDYMLLPEHTNLQDIIKKPGLGDKAGLFGALALIETA